MIINERAIYLAEHLGLDVENIKAYNAKDPKSRRAYLTTIREYFARVKMFMDIYGQAIGDALGLGIKGTTDVTIAECLPATAQWWYIQRSN